MVMVPCQWYLLCYWFLMFNSCSSRKEMSFKNMEIQVQNIKVQGFCFSTSLSQLIKLKWDSAVCSFKK